MPQPRTRIAYVVTVLMLSLSWGALPVAGAASEHSAEVEGRRVYVNVRRSNVRKGPGSSYKALRVLSDGAELTVVGAKGNWYKVALEDGKVGWINRRAVTQTPPDDVVIGELRRQLARVQKENDGLKQEIMRLSDARQDLELENSRLKSQVNLLTIKNEELKSWRAVLWVVLGLSVLFVGWGLGFLTGMFRKQADDRRYDRLMREAGTRNA